MYVLTRSAFLAILALAWTSVALPQETKDQNDSEEDRRLTRVIERWIELNESERDHVAREVARANNGKVDEDFDHWFENLGGDNENGWDRGHIRRNAVR